MPEGKVHWINSKGNLPHGYIERINPVAFSFIKIAIKYEAGQTPKSKATSRNKNHEVTRVHACEFIETCLETKWNDGERAKKFANKVLRDLWNSPELSFHLDDLNNFCQVISAIGTFKNWFEFEHIFYHNEFFKIGREQYCHKPFIDFQPYEIERINELANLAFYSLLGSKILLKNNANPHLIDLFRKFSFDAQKESSKSNLDFQDYRHLVEPYIKILKTRKHVWGFGNHFSIGLNPCNTDTSVPTLAFVNARYSGPMGMWYMLACEEAVMTVFDIDELISNFNNRNYEYITSHTPLTDSY